jgi:hypothetical protein
MELGPTREAANCAVTENSPASYETRMFIAKPFKYDTHKRKAKVTVITVDQLRTQI